MSVYLTAHQNTLGYLVGQCGIGLRLGMRQIELGSGLIVGWVRLDYRKKVPAAMSML